MDKSVWKLFSKHHYLDHKHNNSANVYICYVNDCPAGFISAQAQPGLLKNQWRCHRLVVLPDYQGVGIGLRMLNDVAKLYTDIGKTFRIVTSAPSLLNALDKNKDWRCIAFGKKNPDGLMGTKKRKDKNYISSTAKRISASFYYKPDKNDNN
jgi:GNAT superfamily N-acetyltransferase